MLEVLFVRELVQGSAKDLAHLAPEWCGPLRGLLASLPRLGQEDQRFSLGASRLRPRVERGLSSWGGH